MSTISPITTQPFLNISGFKNYYTSTTTLTIGAGQCRDSTNGIDINLGNYLGLTNPGASANTTTVINTAVVGVNGLDTGTLAASTWYYIYTIADQTGYNAPACIMSKSSTGPILPNLTTNPGLSPSGYSSWRLIGTAVTNGSTVIIKFFQAGHLNTRTYEWDSSAGGISVLSAGNATTATAVSLAAAVPILIDATGGTGPIVNLNATFTPAVAAHVFNLLPTGATGTTSLSGTGVVAAVAQTMPIAPMITGVSSSNPAVSYFVTASGDALTLIVTGYTIFI